MAVRGHTPGGHDRYASEDRKVRRRVEVQQLIAASFLENLPRQGEDGMQIREMIGPNLKRQLKAME